MTVGKPTRVAMRDSRVNRVCNNFSMKLPGLFPSATSYYIPSGQENLKKFFPHVDYVLTSSCKPEDWKYKNGKSLNLNHKYLMPSRIGGNYVIM